MPLDGIVINAITTELQQKLIGGKIDKIHQPEKDEIYMQIRNQNYNFRLLLSASANHARTHLTNIVKNNPLQAPLFSMVLRKHLIGGRIKHITQPNFERIIQITIESINELGEMSAKTLIIEMMGRHSNIILVNDRGKIIDSIKHINQEISRVREVLPGLDYQTPPSQGKYNPLALSRQDYIGLLLQDTDTMPLEKRISSSLTGISLVSAQEIVYRIFGSKTAIPDLLLDNQKEIIIDTMLDFINQITNKKYQPSILLNEDGNPKDFFAFKYEQFIDQLQQSFTDVCAMLDHYFFSRDKKDRITQRSANLRHILQRNLDRCVKKLSLQEEKICESSQRDQYRFIGELITSNIYSLHRGEVEAHVLNYDVDPAEIIVIPLDVQKTPAENAQWYFKQYTKAKRTHDAVTKQIAENKEEIVYLENQLHNLDKCTEDIEILEIQAELVQEGFMKPQKMKKTKPVPSNPYHYQSSEGFDIYVGKNNNQNDQLTLKTAHNEDVWLHTKVIPGSHVIIKVNGKPLSEKTLLEAATLAAYYSKAKLSTNVPVDYTIRKFVKKPVGAKPGMVIYTNQKTLYISPDEQQIKNIKML